MILNSNPTINFLHNDFICQIRYKNKHRCNTPTDRVARHVHISSLYKSAPPLRKFRILGTKCNSSSCTTKSI